MLHNIVYCVEISYSMVHFILTGSLPSRNESIHCIAVVKNDRQFIACFQFDDKNRQPINVGPSAYRLHQVPHVCVHRHIQWMQHTGIKTKKKCWWETFLFSDLLSWPEWHPDHAAVWNCNHARSSRDGVCQEYKGIQLTRLLFMIPWHLDIV